jgi:hypothetical protein
VLAVLVGRRRPGHHLVQHTVVALRFDDLKFVIVRTCLKEALI